MSLARIRCLTILALVAAAPGSAPAQAPTIKQRVEANGGKPLVIVTTPEVFPLSADDLTRRSDLIVVGTLVRLRSYVSEDGTEVLTDYQIVPNRVMLSRNQDVGATPGRRPSLIVTVLGGEVRVKGTLVTVENTTLQPIKNQGEFLLFARKSSHGENGFYGDATGIFELLGEDVRSLIKGSEPHADFRAVLRTPLLQRIQVLTQAK